MIGEILLPCHRQARWGSSWRRPNGRFGSILFTFSMRVKQLVQRGPGDTQLSRQRRLADLPVHVPPVVPGQVRDDHSFAAVVPTLTFRDCDSLPLAFQQVGPLKLLNFPANCKKMQFSISDLQHRYLNTAVKLGYTLSCGAVNHHGPAIRTPEKSGIHLTTNTAQPFSSTISDFFTPRASASRSDTRGDAENKVDPGHRS